MRYRVAPVLVDLFIIGLAFGVRLVLLGDANIWSDEGLSVWAARQGLLASAEYTAADVHPPLYFWLLHYWLTWAGQQEFAVRFLSVMAGTLTVPAVGYLARLIVPGQRWVARLAMLLLALSRFSVWWSQEARMYIVAGLWATIGLALAVRLRWRPSRSVGLAYVLVSTAGLWTLYLTVFVLVIEGLYWLWSLREESSWSGRGRLLVSWCFLESAVVAGFLPWLVYMFPRLPTWSKQVSFDPRQYLEIYATLLSLGVTANVEQFRWAVALVMLLVVAGLSLVWLRPGQLGSAVRSAPLLVTLALLVPPAGVWLVTTMPRSFGKPEARYLVPFAAFFYVAEAWAITALSSVAGRARQLLAVGAVLALMGLSVWSLSDYYGGRYLADEYKSIALTLRAHFRAGDVVVLHTNDTWPAFAYEWDGDFVATPPAERQDEGGADYFLAPLWRDHEGIWLVLNENALATDPGGLVEGWLSGRAVAGKEWRFGTRRLLLFAKTPGRAATLGDLAPGFRPAAPLRRLTEGDLSLVGWEQPLRRLRAGEIAYLFAYVDRNGGGGAVEVDLSNAPEVRASADVPSGVGTVRVPLTVLVPPDTSPGGAWWQVHIGTGQVLAGPVRLVSLASPGAATSTEPTRILTATFGEPALVRLRGYDLGGATVPGGTLVVTLHWQAVETPALSYKVFVHVTDPAGQVVAQRDDFPMEGKRPTTTWRRSDSIMDVYRIPLRPDLPSGIYKLVVGLYDPATGKRLGPARDDAGQSQPLDQIGLAEVEVR